MKKYEETGKLEIRIHNVFSGDILIRILRKAIVKADFIK